jgi:ribosomal protein L7Ae-like RNA K-turn-binding protein
LQLNNSVLSFNKKDIKKVYEAVMKRLRIAQQQLIIAEDTDKPSIILTLTPIREESKLEINIKYLVAGQMKFIDLKFTAFQDETQFNIEREA